LISRALSEAYRSVLPTGVYPAAILFLDVPLEEVDVNVHPAKTEVRFRRAVAVGEAVRDAVRAALVSAGYVRLPNTTTESDVRRPVENTQVELSRGRVVTNQRVPIDGMTAAKRETESEPFRSGAPSPVVVNVPTLASGPVDSPIDSCESEREIKISSVPHQRVVADEQLNVLPPLVSAAHLVRDVPVESLSRNVQLLGQLEDTYIVASDEDGLLLIGQHVAHERILYDKFHALEVNRRVESQNLLIPETFDLTPAQVIAFDAVENELESYGFGLMRLSGRTIAIRAVPVDLPVGGAHNLLNEILNTIDVEKLGTTRDALRHAISVSLACHAAVKAGTPLAPEKMGWIIENLLSTSAPTTCPHGRPVVLRLAVRDLEKGFSRS
jgi:DNA mismatch repair protein MutL